MKTQLTSLAKVLFYSLLVLCLATTTSCKKKKGCTDPASKNFDPEAEEDDGSCVYEQTYVVPSTYNFSKAAYKGQTVRILLLKDLSTEIEKAKTQFVDSTTLISILENNPDKYTSIASGKKLSDKISDAATKDSVYKWLKEISKLSASSSTYVRANGVDLKQMVEKTLMGAVFYYRAVNDYLNTVPTKDNVTITAEGTAMEHAFDEAFGYFGAARDYNAYTDAEIVSPGQKDSNADGTFDPSTERIFFYAQTAAKRDLTVTSFDFTKTTFDAFLKGRAAITNIDYSVRDAQIAIIKQNWDMIIAATVVSYANKVQSNISTGSTDLNKHWAEMKGYLDMVRHNSSNKLGASNIATLNGLMGSKPSDTDATKLEQVKATIKSAYALTDAQVSAL